LSVSLLILKQQSLQQEQLVGILEEQEGLQQMKMLSKIEVVF